MNLCPIVAPTVPRLALQTLHWNWAPRQLLKIARQRGTDTFDAPVRCDEVAQWLPALPKGLFYSESSGVALHIKNVSAHVDGPVGMLDEHWTGTVFALLTGKGELQVGCESTRVDAGMWVLFDDSVLHSFQAERKVLAVSFQVGTVPQEP